MEWQMPGKWALDDPGSNLSYTPDSAQSLPSGSLSDDLHT
jgi:hypothetical protein